MTWLVPHLGGCRKMACGPVCVTLLLVVSREVHQNKFSAACLDLQRGTVHALAVEQTGADDAALFVDRHGSDRYPPRIKEQIVHIKHVSGGLAVFVLLCHSMLFGRING
jgi:hypothetical protein